MKRFSIFLFAFLPMLLSAQNFRHYDFLGAGHDNEVTVTASSSDASAKKTTDGFPIQNSEQLIDASRFLAQATFGADFATIEMTAAMGKEAWMDEQFALPQASVTDEMFQVLTHFQKIDPDEGAGAYLMRSAWTTNNMTSADILRQRIAYSLSQIMVINTRTDLFEDFGIISSAFYDNLSKNAFQNYRSLIGDVTLSPAMGFFLSHYGNPKADPSRNIHPDENYAREIMQLFSIGLWELNPDGTRKYDANGQFIPTYTNADIKEFAKVFTGLSDGRPNGDFARVNDADESTFRIPMKMYEEFHEQSSKNLLNGFVIPAGQPGMTDVDMTLDHLSNHPNTAPFISKSLIKFLTTSNPSPGYVSRVASVFNPSEANNFQSVIRAILLDPEARKCEPTETYTFGKLREPVVRYFNLLKAFPMSSNQYGDYPADLFDFDDAVGQSPLNAPSVFNFFLSEYSPQGPINQNYLVAPEFQILNSTNAIGTVNQVSEHTLGEEPLTSEGIVGDEDYIQDFSKEYALINQPDALVERLNILLANGLLSDHTKSVVKNAMAQLDEDEDKLRMALFLILISPDYVILK